MGQWLSTMLFGADHAIKPSCGQVSRNQRRREEKQKRREELHAQTKIIKKKQREEAKAARQTNFQQRLQSAIDAGDVAQRDAMITAVREARAEHVKAAQEKRDRARSNLKNAVLGVCIDCAWWEHMNEQEQKSLVKQIRFCYAAASKRAADEELGASACIWLSLASASPGWERQMDKTCDGWRSWALRIVSDEDIDHESVSASRTLVYLSADADDELDVLSPDELYVIGGIVDRNRLKNATIDKARRIPGCLVKRIPVADLTYRVLTVNHVFDLLVARAAGSSWEAACAEALPKRKEKRQ
ncbi:tRNA (guanine(9)-N1)-methyltransferase [Porphyridium purpureum]|uniref:tRNA (guanine(9)-N(1))-methyltransferase n=1 Tax=Porphyridium purpureum TaxID=35688 RepID=A0A5J4YYZ3_PORPP|nr:tRNA (guanine(9)-N1)-methyltransferase [Porphyridium purpureum]|eukprot:POR5056..scf209_3